MERAAFNAGLMQGTSLCITASREPPIDITSARVSWKSSSEGAVGSTSDSMWTSPSGVRLQLRPTHTGSPVSRAALRSAAPCSASRIISRTRKSAPASAKA